VNVTRSYFKVGAATVSNVCGNTPRGDPTSTILVGGHSDGVAAGPGTNDDGSGSMTTMHLAISLSKLLANASYPLVNMVKFCWFGGEEQGLLGSRELVRVGVLANNDSSAPVGSRAKDWAIMIDLDMLGSQNFVYGVYDANQYVPNNTPASAINGSKLLTNIFYEYYGMNNLPTDWEQFDGRSDYGPFLSAGIPAGGVFSGADAQKTIEQRTRYTNTVGYGGMAQVIQDTCYHRACDTIDNIHWGCYTNMTQSAAYALEKLALMPNLRAFLGNPLPQVEQMEEQRNWNLVADRIDQWNAGRIWEPL